MPMIRGVWPTGRCQAFHRAALQADWFTLPLGNQSCDLVLGDGSFVVFDHAKASRLTRSVRRVLKRGGKFLVRVFVRRDADEPPAVVWDHLLARRIGNFHVFKFRLLMSLRREQGDVRVADAWEFFRARCSDLEALARKLGWPVEEVQTIAAYGGQSAVYWFPTVREFRALVAAEFKETACLWPRYEMGECCPTFVLEPRP
jgi:SAM-dependent methyltransferase